MIGIMQTKKGVGGNCFQASLATILGLQLDDVPHFFENSDKEWSDDIAAECYDKIQDWLAVRNLRFLELGYDDQDEDLWDRHCQGLCLVTHKATKIQGAMHTVVFRDGKPCWDPNIGDVAGSELPAGIEMVGFIRLLEPDKKDKEV